MIQRLAAIAWISLVAIIGLVEFEGATVQDNPFIVIALVANIIAGVVLYCSAPRL